MSGAERVGSNIEITGVAQTVAALRAFEPDIRRRLNKEIKAALDLVKQGAEARYPAGSWQIRVNTRSILGTVSARGGGTRAARWADSDGGIRAAIFEFAGSAQEGRTPQARAMIKSLNERYGGTGRFLWASWDQNGRAVLTDIKLSVEAAERDLQTALDRAGESY